MNGCIFGEFELRIYRYRHVSVGSKSLHCIFVDVAGAEIISCSLYRYVGELGSLIIFLWGNRCRRFLNLTCKVSTGTGI